MRTVLGRRPALGMAAAGAIARASRAADTAPIAIGFAEAQTGSLAAVGKSGILAMNIWADDVNARGGLLGRPVKLVFYDNQSNPANVPGLYVKLLDVDHVDIELSDDHTTHRSPHPVLSYALVAV